MAVTPRPNFRTRLSATTRRPLLSSWQSRVLLALSLTWAAPALACGSFAPRPTPTPTTPPVAQVTQAPGESTGGDATPVPIELATEPAAETPTPLPTPTFTATPAPGTALTAGQPARVVAPGGLNMRDAASTGGTLIVQLGTGQRVDVLEGPVSADGFTWWRVDDGQGNVGWVAQGDGETEWLSPRLGDVQAVNRPPRVGDRVTVSTEVGQQLSVRALPGTDAPLLTRVNANDQFTVLAGPQEADGFTWYQIRNDAGTIEGWAADGDGTTRWLSPLE